MNKLFLRTCNSDGTSYGGFKWNLEIGGITEAPDWNPELECGGGLHGLLHGKGDGENLDHSKDSLWMACEALGPIVDLENKIKTSKAKTLFVGDLKGATDFLIGAGCNPSEVVGAFITGGDSSKIIGADWSTLTGGDDSIITGGRWSTLTGGRWSTVTGGDNSIITGGNWSTLTGGNYSSVTGGEYSTLTGGNWSTLKGGHWSTVTDGNYSSVTGGDYSNVTGGKYSTVTGGNGSIVTGGYHSTVTGGDGSTVTGGEYSTVTGGDGSILSLKWFDGKRTRIVTAYVGEDGIEPNVAYKLDDNGKFVRA
jgi:hypothetical protein